MKILNNLVLLFSFLFLMSSCSFNSVDGDIRAYKKNKAKKNFKEADKDLTKIILKNSSVEIDKYALLEKANLNLLFLKQPIEAVKAYKKLFLISKNQDLANNYLLMAAGIYLDNMNQFEKAIFEIKLLNTRNIDLKTKIKAKKILIKANIKLKKYYQALIHIDEAINYEGIEEKDKFDFLLSKANILLQTDKNQKSVQIYSLLKSDYPLRYRKERLYVSLVVGLESLGRYDESIKELISARTEFPNSIENIDKKIAKIKALQKNQPGAEGLRR